MSGKLICFFDELKQIFSHYESIIFQKYKTLVRNSLL